MVAQPEAAGLVIVGLGAPSVLESRTQQVGLGPLKVIGVRPQAVDRDRSQLDRISVGDVRQDLVTLGDAPVRILQVETESAQIDAVFVLHVDDDVAAVDQGLEDVGDQAGQAAAEPPGHHWRLVCRASQLADHAGQHVDQGEDRLYHRADRAEGRERDEHDQSGYGAGDACGEGVIPGQAPRRHTEGAERDYGGETHDPSHHGADKTHYLCLGERALWLSLEQQAVRCHLRPTFAQARFDQLPYAGQESHACRQEACRLQHDGRDGHRVAVGFASPRSSHEPDGYSYHGPGRDGRQGERHARARVEDTLRGPLLSAIKLQTPLGPVARPAATSSAAYLAHRPKPTWSSS